MENEHGHVYWDVTSFEYNLHAADAVRWLILMPCVMMAAGVLYNAMPRAPGAA